MPPAARVTDMHTCPQVEPGPVPHVGGPVLPAGEPTVLIGYMPAARVGGMAVCVGPPDTIQQGEPTVQIGNMDAARLGDPTAHGGAIAWGVLRCRSGSSAQAEALQTSQPFCAECARKAQGGRSRCGGPWSRSGLGATRAASPSFRPVRRFAWDEATRWASSPYRTTNGCPLHHFSLSWDGSICRFDDSGSLAGSTLNGERKPPRGTGVVGNGGYVQAGLTVFSVFIEATTPPRGKPREPTADAKGALATLRAEGTDLFGVLDASRDKRICELLHESVDPNRSLYDGVQGDALAEVAPYLVNFAPGSGLLERVVHEGWGRAGYLLQVQAAP